MAQFFWRSRIPGPRDTVFSGVLICAPFADLILEYPFLGSFRGLMPDSVSDFAIWGPGERRFIERI